MNEINKMIGVRLNDRICYGLDYDESMALVGRILIFILLEFILLEEITANNKKLNIEKTFIYSIAKAPKEAKGDIF